MISRQVVSWRVAFRLDVTLPVSWMIKFIQVPMSHLSFDRLSFGHLSFLHLIGQSESTRVAPINWVGKVFFLNSVINFNFFSVEVFGSSGSRGKAFNNGFERPRFRSRRAFYSITLWTSVYNQEKMLMSKKKEARSGRSSQWGSIRCKHVVRGQHLSQIKARLLWLVENVLSPIKTQQPKSGTSAATYRLMEPQWRPPDSNPAKTVTHWKYPGSKISY